MNSTLKRDRWSTPPPRHAPRPPATPSPRPHTHTAPFSASAEVQRRYGPGVAGLLGAAALQLLHQHLAAPPQSVADLPKGAAAAQGAAAVLEGATVSTVDQLGFFSLGGD